MGRPKYHSVTDIVATVYCEQKAVFDRERGDARPLSVRAKAAAGSFEHYRFEIEGRTRAAVDRRCFIATAIYGADAPETVFLRSWRDSRLMPAAAGRFAVRIYYALSPRLVPILSRWPCLAALIRAVLDGLLRRLGMSR